MRGVPRFVQVLLRSRSKSDFDQRHGPCPDLRTRMTDFRGVADQPGETTIVLLERADRALYRVKSQGRNQVESAG